jgi:hypothetical protein
MRILSWLGCLVCTLVARCVICPGPPKSVLPLLDELLALLEEGGHASKVHRLTQAISIACPGAPTEVQQLAHLSGGSHFERNLHRWASRQVFSCLFPAPYEFIVPFKRGDRQHFAILPHELFGSIYSAGLDIFHRLFTGGERNLQEWWERAAAIDDSWYRHHPVIRATPNPLLRVPYGVHGDDAGMAGAESVLVITWGSVAVYGPTLDTRLLFSVVKVNEMIKPDTLQECYSVLRWSLEALARGRYPDRDHRDVLFSPTHHPERFRWAKELIAGEMVGAWSEMRGDWKWLAESLYLQTHYGTPGICHLCRAHRIIRRLDYREVGPDARHRNTLVTAWDWWVLYSSAVLVSPLIMIVGFNCWRVLIDALHTLDLGLYQHAAASAVWQFTEPREDGGHYDGDTRQARLDNCYDQYKRWCAASLVL